MGIAKTIVNKSTNNLGRSRQGLDHISGLTVFDTKPVEYGSNDIRLITSVSGAETLGITALAYPLLHYHISEYFRLAGNSQLYVGIFPNAGSSGTYTFDEVVAMQAYAEGQIRQLGVWIPDTLSIAYVNTLQAQKEKLDESKTGLSIFFTADITPFTIETLPDLSTGANYGVSVFTDQSFNGTGATLYGTLGVTVGCLGAALGVASSVPVQRSIANREFVTLLGGQELDQIATGDGTSYKSLTEADIEAISEKQYVQLVKVPGVSGTFFNIDYTSQGDGDLNRISKNRVIDKAIRVVNAALTPKVNSELPVNSDGTLTEAICKTLEQLVDIRLANMVSAGELSGFSVYINPAQNINSTNNLNVEVDLLPVGVAETITINIGFRSQL